MERYNLSIDSKGFAELSSELLSLGKCVWFTAHGGSMQPLVRSGDVLMVEPVQNKPLRLGMVVLCIQAPGQVVVHRIINRKRDQYLIQGDHVEKPDGWFGREDIRGIITRVEREGKSISLLTFQAWVLAVMAVLKSRGFLNRKNKYLSCVYSKIKQSPIFKLFFS